jgi:hypothetical protein
MGRAYSANGKNRNAYGLLLGNPDGKIPLGGPRHRWVDNIIKDHREIRWDGMDWMHLTQDRYWLREFMNLVMNLCSL